MFLESDRGLLLVGTERGVHHVRRVQGVDVVWRKRGLLLHLADRKLE